MLMENAQPNAMIIALHAVKNQLHIAHHVKQDSMFHHIHISASTALITALIVTLLMENAINAKTVIM